MWGQFCSEDGPDRSMRKSEFPEITIEWKCQSKPKTEKSSQNPTVTVLVWITVATCSQERRVKNEGPSEDSKRP